MKKAFCERNLKPVFALLVLLIAATVVWAVVSGKTAGAASPKRKPGSPPPKRLQPVKAGAAQGSPPVDATTIATPKGGIKLITERGTRPPSPGFGLCPPSRGLAPRKAQPSPTPGAPARMQLVAASPRSRHAFNTVSSLILPSVVSIHATRNELANGAPRAGGAGGGIRFADPFDGIPEKFARNRAYETVGSGFIIDSRGYVLTNYHVISRTADLLVSVSGGINKDFPATIVAADPAADLALIKLSGAPSLPEALLGDSHLVQVGDWVLAFGSPFGLEQTVTQGIISNKRKSLVVEGVSYGDMLQTDAPINRGSSGGPLANLKAEVIGINTAIYGPNGVFSGAGFAIPVDRAKAFLARCRRVFDRERR